MLIARRKYGFMDFLSRDAITKVKKRTRRGSQNRAIQMAMVALSNFSTPEQKEEAKKEIGYSLIKQTGRIVEGKAQEAFNL